VIILKTISIILISFFFIGNNLYSEIPLTMTTSDPQLDVLSRYSTTLSSVPNTMGAKAQLKNAVSILNLRDIAVIKKHPYYTSLGDIYMYAAFRLEKEIEIDETIKILERAILIRKDPTSVYKLTTLYKKKYDEALINGDEYNQVMYGRKVYSSLNLYLNMQPQRRKSYKKIIKYFKLYDF